MTHPTARTFAGCALALFLSFSMAGSVHAEHDSGQGKSQDGGSELDSVRVAPEPSSLWYFLLGAGALAAYRRGKAVKPA